MIKRKYLYSKSHTLNILLLIWGGIHSSIAYYYESVLISGQLGRVFLFDSIGIVLFIWCFVWFSRPQERFKLNKGFLFLFFTVAFLTVTALIKGLINENDIDLILKEFHVLVISLVVLGFVWCVGVRQAVQVQKLVFHGAAIATGLIIFVAYTIFPSSEAYSYALDNYGSTMEIAPLASMYGHKIKIVPYLLAFLCAYYIWSILHATNWRETVSSVLIFILLILIAILSNMRSAIVGASLGVLICVSIIFFIRGSILQYARLLLLTLAGMVVLGFVWGEYLSEDRWIQSQIVEKASTGVLQQDSSRISAMMQSFGIYQDDSVYGFGYGMGAGFSYHGNVLSQVNPGDSGFYHVYITHGLLFVYVIMFLLLYASMRMFRNAIMTRGRSEQQIVIANLAGIATLLLAQFNDSCWAVIPDVIIASFILAISLNYQPGRL